MKDGTMARLRVDDWGYPSCASYVQAISMGISAGRKR
jgi:hypothetical protein